MLDRSGVPLTVADVAENVADGDEPNDDLWMDGATGADPDSPDPGCLHPWRHLQFAQSTEDDPEDLVCSRCDRTWLIDDDPREALLTVWQSTRLAIAGLHRALDAATEVVALLGDVERCAWCNLWSDDPDDFVLLRYRRVCPEHIGQYLADGAVDGENEQAAAWLDSSLSSGTPTLENIWVLEKALVEHPDLLDLLPGSRRTAAATVSVGSLWQRLLELPAQAKVRVVVERLAALLELPPPASRPGRAILLGVLARVERLAGQDAPLSESALVDAFDEVAPETNRDRATATMDLYRHDMPDDGILSGDMADDLVEALLSRVATELALRTGEEGPKGGGDHIAPR